MTLVHRLIRGELYCASKTSKQYKNLNKNVKELTINKYPISSTLIFKYNRYERANYLHSLKTKVHYFIVLNINTNTTTIATFLPSTDRSLFISKMLGINF